MCPNESRECVHVCVQLFNVLFDSRKADVTAATKKYDGHLLMAKQT